jgi:hypothetical protein
MGAWTFGLVRNSSSSLLRLGEGRGWLRLMRASCFLIPIFLLNLTAHAGTSTRYVLGESKIFSADESVLYEENAVLAQRVYRPEQNEIFECALVIDPNRGASLYKTKAFVNGSQFSMTDETRSFSGTGSLFGSPWAWSAWEFSISLANGSGSLYGFETFERDGMTSVKRFSNNAGQVQNIVRETFHDVSEATYRFFFGTQQRSYVFLSVD